VPDHPRCGRQNPSPLRRNWSRHGVPDRSGVPVPGTIRPDHGVSHYVPHLDHRPGAVPRLRGMALAAHRRSGVLPAVPVLVAAFCRQFRRGRGLGHSPGVPVRHELGTVFRHRRQLFRPDPRLRRHHGLHARIRLPLHHALRVEAGRPENALFFHHHGGLCRVAFGFLDSRGQLLDADPDRRACGERHLRGGQLSGRRLFPGSAPGLLPHVRGLPRSEPVRHRCGLGRLRPARQARRLLSQVV